MALRGQQTHTVQGTGTRRAGRWVGVEEALQPPKDLGDVIAAEAKAIERPSHEQPVLCDVVDVPGEGTAHVGPFILEAVQPGALWAEAAAQQQRHAIAVALLSAQTASFHASHLVQFPTHRAKADRTLSEARAGLDPETFDRAWKEGTAMSGPQAFDYAVDQLGQGE